MSQKKHFQKGLVVVSTILFISTAMSSGVTAKENNEFSKKKMNEVKTETCLKNRFIAFNDLPFIVQSNQNVNNDSLVRSSEMKRCCYPLERRGFQQPLPQALYVNNKYIGYFFTCVIIGDIDIIVGASESDLVQVVFKIDDRVVASFPPNESNIYIWTWKRGEPPFASLFFHYLELKIIFPNGENIAGFPLWRFV